MTISNANGVARSCHAFNQYCHAFGGIGRGYYFDELKVTNK